MSDELKDLRRDLDEMIKRQLLHRHESIMRDEFTECLRQSQ